MTLLVTVMRVGLSGLLTLAPAAVLKKDQMRITMVLSFLAIFAACKVAGLIFAAVVTGLLLLFALWVRFVGHANAGAKHVLFIVTIVLSALFLAQHVVHLPIRFALDQPSIMIASNVVGILVATTMLVATLELLIVKNRKNHDTPNQGTGGNVVKTAP